jgi:putative membrane protein
MIRTHRTAMAGALALGTTLVFAGTATAQPTGQDSSWMVAAHQSNLTEIAAGKAAQAKASSATVRELGQMFVQDHTALDAKLKTAAGTLNVKLPATPNPTQQTQLKQAGALSGNAFDSLWLQQQLAGHRMALAATKTETANGQDASTLTLARSATPIIAHHLQELLAASSGSSPTSVNAGSGGQAARSSLPAGMGAAALGLALLAGAVRVLRRRAHPLA